MSKAVYSNVHKPRKVSADFGEPAEQTPQAPVRASRKAVSAPPAEAFYSEEAPPVGLVGTPVRAFVLGFSVVALMAAFAVLIFMVANRNSGTAPPVQAGQSVHRDIQSQVPVLSNMSATGGLAQGSVPPSFDWNDPRTGQKMSLAGMKGHTVWINFWGTWCPPCKAEMPEIQKVYDLHKNDNLTVLGISMAPRDDPGMVLNFLKQYQYDWTFIHDGDQQLALKYQAYSIPMSYFIGADGTIKVINVGGIQADTMEQLLAQAR